MSQVEPSHAISTLSLPGRSATPVTIATAIERLVGAKAFVGESGAQIQGLSGTVRRITDFIAVIRELAEEAKEVQLLMNNCYGDKAVNNAAQLAAML